MHIIRWLKCLSLRVCPASSGRQAMSIYLFLTLCGTAALLLALGYGCKRAQEAGLSQPIFEKRKYTMTEATLKAWSNAGFVAGKVTIRGDELLFIPLIFSRLAEEIGIDESDALPAFAYYGQGWQFGVLGKLPVPKVPFGLRLEGPETITATVLTELTHLKDNLQALDVSDKIEIGPFGPRRRISNRELKEVGSLKNLKALSLAGTDITDAGLEQLMALEKLEMLNLARTRVTSKDLAFISSLKNLRILSLSETQVSNNGMMNLRELKRLQWLNLSKTRVSDRGLEHLKALKNLRNLILEGTWVSEQAILEFRKAVPECVVSYNPSVHPPFPRPDD
jgi:hypothetical protein